MADNNDIYELTHTVENNEDNFEFDATEAASDLVVSPATFKLTHTRDGNTDEFDFGDGDTPTPTGDVSNSTVTFTEALVRDNITSGSTLAVLMGKIKKWFSDLKAVAFSGSYNDLSNTPTIPTVNNATITFTQGGVTKGSIDLNQSNDETIALDAGGGGGTVPDISATASADALSSSTPTVTVTKTGTDEAPNFDFAFSGLKGAQGNPGTPGQDGAPGADGSDGTSAYCSVSKSGNTATITCTDANGTTTAQISDGTDGSNGQDGAPGADGSSAYCSVSKSGNTATITCTDKNGTTTATVSDGSDGSDGAQGPAGPGVAAGGTAGQFLKKSSSTDYATEWGDISEVPSGGNNGDVLTKAATGPMWAPPVEELPAISSGDAGKVLSVNSAETGVEWVTPSGGGGSFPYEVVEVNKSISGSLVQWGYSDYEIGVTLPNTTDVPVGFVPMLAGSWQCVVSNLFYTAHPVTGKPVVKVTLRNISNATASVSSITGLLFYKHSS